MGQKYKVWEPLSQERLQTFEELVGILRSNRSFSTVDDLRYGDYGLQDATRTISQAIRSGKRIALYADYDVDGTMSCVSWIWYLEAIGFKNFIHYIPCRFKEGYGLNLNAIRHLIDDEKAELIITMDTGITANEEAAYCRSRGVEFICTDHHKIQPDKMPDCIILNPKMHPDPLYQELCGCGITFVLLRKLAQEFPISQNVWNDLMALVGMATICDVVPLNGVNHKLANLGVKALLRSDRLVLRRLRDACSLLEALDEKDVGFRIGPRINAVGRLEHADAIIEAFIGSNPEPLVRFMDECNEERKLIERRIVKEAIALANAAGDAPILFLGGDWHPGVVGIAASKIAEMFWRPTWLFQRGEKLCKGSARSIEGFDVTTAMSAASTLFQKFGGHRAAGGFAFNSEVEAEIRTVLTNNAENLRREFPQLWQSRLAYDCELPLNLANLTLANQLNEMKPFGHGFKEPLFLVQAPIDRVNFYQDKTTGEPKHTAVQIRLPGGERRKIMFFNEVHHELQELSQARFLVTAGKNTFRGQSELSLMGRDWDR